jgi:hypothetical protein
MKTAEEFKGTNGEWKIQEPYNTFVYGSDGKLICQIKYDPFSEESIANAQLIAAAPVLLEALLSLMDGVANLPPLVAIEGVLKTEWEQGLKAINKALGK